MKTLYVVSADHPSADWALNRQHIEVSSSRYSTGEGEPTTRYSAWLPKFGYVCDFATPQAAINDLLRANGCTNIRIHN